MTDKERLDEAIIAINGLSEALLALTNGSKALAEQHLTMAYAICFLTGELRALGAVDGPGLAERAIAQMKATNGLNEEREKLLRNLLSGNPLETVDPHAVSKFTVIQGGKDDVAG